MKALHQPHPPGKETKSKNYDPIAWGKETPNSQLDKMKNKNSQDKIYKEKIGKLPEKEFRAMRVKIQNLNTTREKM